MRYVLKTMLLWVCLLTAGTSALGSSPLPPSRGGLPLPRAAAETASAIVRGTVVDESSHATTSDSVIVSDYTIAIVDCRMGRLSPGSLVTVRLPGGSANGRTFVSSRTKHFKVGMDCLLFLKQCKSRTWYANSYNSELMHFEGQDLVQKLSGGRNGRSVRRPSSEVLAEIDESLARLSPHWQAENADLIVTGSVSSMSNTERPSLVTLGSLDLEVDQILIQRSGKINGSILEVFLGAAARQATTKRGTRPTFSETDYGLWFLTWAPSTATWNLGETHAAFWSLDAPSAKTELQLTQTCGPAYSLEMPADSLLTIVQQRQ